MYGTIGLTNLDRLFRTSFVIAVTILISQVNPRSAEAQQSPSPPPYQQLRYEEDYRYLRDPTHRTDLWDTVKYIPISWR